LLKLSKNGKNNENYMIKSIKFVINYQNFRKDARACFLRKYFVFMIVPMLNPDGVYHGHYRMDAFNNNLNRFYHNADPEK